MFHFSFFFLLLSQYITPEKPYPTIPPPHTYALRCYLKKVTEIETIYLDYIVSILLRKLQEKNLLSR